MQIQDGSSLQSAFDLNSFSFVHFCIKKQRESENGCGDTRTHAQTPKEETAAEDTYARTLSQLVQAGCLFQENVRPTGCHNSGTKLSRKTICAAGEPRANFGAKPKTRSEL